MSLRVLTVVSNSDLEDFINFPYTLYHSAPFWVPPLKSQELELLSPGLHPFWFTAEQRLFLAKRDGNLVGRIAAIIDHKYNDYAHERCGAFGFFECENDPEAAHCLLQSAADWLIAKGMHFLRGPVNPSTNYTCGLLIAAECQPALMMPWNFAYYQDLLESWHMYKEQDLFAYRIYRRNLQIAPEIQEHLALAAKDSQFSCRCANPDLLADDIATMLDLYRESWAKNWYFSPLSKAEEEKLVHDLLSLVDINFFVLFFHADRAVAGMVALPDFTPLLKELEGTLGFKTPLSYFKTRRQFGRGYRIMLFGIKEEYRLLGLPALLFNYMLDKAKEKEDLEWVEGSWVLEDNRSICELIEDFSGKITHRYRIYRKDLFPA